MKRALARGGLAAAIALLAAVDGRAEESGEPGARRSAWALPASGRCDGAWRGAASDGGAALRTAQVFGHHRLAALQSHLPKAVWEQRERFFYQGMQIEIGACFRDYAPPAFFQHATTRNRGRSRLLENGGLSAYLEGLPFAPSTIDPQSPDAGARWAWNFVHRYQGAGFRGRFRVTRFVDHGERMPPVEGRAFKLQLAHRADHSPDLELTRSRGHQWVAGGRIDRPALARDYAWRQFRNVAHQADPRRSDDLFAYVPAHRRVRRLNASMLEGLHFPTLAARAPSAPVGIGIDLDAGSDGTAFALSRRGGFEGIEMRPLLHNFRVLGVRDLLAPLNAARPMYPADAERDFGPWGLSFASDRWDLRRVLVLEAIPHERNGLERVVYYLDLQTLHPLYTIGYGPGGEPIDIAMFVGRWSEDRADYPGWPDDAQREVRVIDPVGAAFVNLSDRGSWRREAWDLVSVPPAPRFIDRLLSVGELLRGG